ncbi:P-loop containing nucleoside triphosphate hydrolase protein [Lipomyces tetrasporus]|uniref:P-loop containing nucleoside triphosphate hydrolase protein n=1 Tax=Lipomyces tetrasporus TaxID=54092 RepID=A0AAD7VTW1_9ASCO|nr:P-loop containing nucleoside triphosphate hydrolase protein [Lipomyces tetrasporus]KAJ8102487.1 P-loop containing nucleoside triphosphate hydrolase protein [Lipomyces tetrasporus]
MTLSKEDPRLASSDVSRQSSLPVSSEDPTANEKTEAVVPVSKDSNEDEFAHLPPEEAEILRAQVLVTPAKVSFFKLYRYATAFDLAVLVVGYFCSIAAGALLPLMTIVFGQLSQTFVDFFAYGGSPEHFQSEINKFSLYFVYLGIGEIVFTFVETFIHIDRGEVLSARIREQYLAATLRQNIGYFDKLGSGEITSRITADTNRVQEGMSEKVGVILTGLATFISAFIIGFIKSWKLTLILISVVVAIVLTMGFLSTFMIKASLKSLDGYSVGGTLAEEVFSSVRNVQAFGVQQRLADEYDKYLRITEKWAFLGGAVLALMLGSLWFYIYCNYALAFWQGSRFVASGTIDVGSIISVLLSMLIGAFSLGQIGPNVRSVTDGTSAAAKIFATIDRQSVIDATSDQGEILESFNGDIELNDIKFIYPSRPDVTVLENMNLKIPAGNTVALVGASGSGKSTIVGLVERFYQPISGTITLDGHDITKLNTKWLRQHISLVSQEPTLFGCSVYENVAHGLIGTKYEFALEDDKRKMVVDACEQANAWSFIQTLPEGLDTNVGERGFLMSGGQKQRIAIARAIVSNPKVLLLDEATSALDTKSEGIVQDALDKAAKSRTTIVIAHRLSTIRDADLIVVMSKGQIVEQGTHNDLLDKRGMYYDLVEAQKIEKLKKPEHEDDSVETQYVIEEKQLEYQEDTNILDMTRTRTKQSISSVAVANRPVLQKKKYGVRKSIVMLFKMNKPELPLMLGGIFCATINGLGYPVQSVFFAKCVEAFQVTPEHYSQMRSTVNLYSGLFFMLAFVQGVAFLGTVGLLSYVGQKLVRRIRFESFRQMLRQDIAFFDREENTTGSLTSTLSKDAQAVEGLSGATLGQILNSLITIVAGTILSIAVAWKLALVCFACMPILVFCGFLRFWMLQRFQERAKAAYDKSASFACEATSSIRTVASLTREEDVCSKYKTEIENQITKSRASTVRSAFLYGLSQGLSFFIMGLGFWYGSGLLKDGTYGTTQFFICFISIVFGSQSAGTVFSFAPDMGKAKQAAENIQTLFHSIPQIDSWSEEGIVPQDVDGNIEFQDVHFRYPTRPEVPVLRGLNLTIHKGQYVALVGSSGCGKSTTIGLIESFYLPLGGKILLDGQDITSLNVNAYRSHIALVQQEPVLYAGSIRHNIALGTPKDVTDEDIYAASKQANIHDFIMSLPDGYDTLCGTKGTLLSGGQKQRIAIARALIRGPKILLLDEATSALDSESEKVVQEALDMAAKGRTTIAVAHRLSTIQNADIIYVFEDGKVLESGTHQELLANRAKYYELVQLQALERT